MQMQAALGLFLFVSLPGVLLAISGLHKWGWDWFFAAILFIWTVAAVSFVLMG